MRKQLKYFLPLGIALLLLVVAEVVRPRPVNWAQSFSKEDKIPYGSYVLYDILPTLFPQQHVEPVYTTMYEALPRQGDSTGNYIVINSEFAPDEYDAEELLDFVASGGSAFIAAETIEGDIADTLGIETNYNFTGVLDSSSFSLANPALISHGAMHMKRYSLVAYFSQFDTTTVTVLGTHADSSANFLAIPFGKGTFYMHTVPLAFTNYNMLRDSNYRYACAALSYLPVQYTLWDEFYKVGRKENRSPLSFVLSSPPLAWAWRLLLASVLLFFVFKAKRSQRAIPIVVPPANATLDFVTTVGKLYFQHGDMKNIAEKKVVYFLEYLRSHLQVQTSVLDDELAEHVARKAGVSIDLIRTVFARIRAVQNAQYIGEKELQELNTAIETFHRESSR